MASSAHHKFFSPLQLLTHLCVFRAMLAGIDGMGISVCVSMLSSACSFLVAPGTSLLAFGHPRLMSIAWASPLRLSILRRERFALRTPDGSEGESAALLTGFFLALENAFTLALVVRRGLYQYPTSTVGGLLFCKVGVV